MVTKLLVIILECAKLKQTLIEISTLP